jgi:hypothetical protein
MSAEMRHLIETATQDGSPEAVQRRIDTRRCHDLVDRLEGDEAALVVRLLGRMDRGRETYGVLRRDDGRVWGQEMLEELLDALVYGSAALVRMEREAGR